MYQTLYNPPNGDAFYDVCRVKGANTPLKQMYDCCREQCKGSPVCRALCSSVYPGTIVEDCALDAGCVESGYYRRECVDAKESQIHQCCLRKCRSGQLTSLPEIERIRLEGQWLDCDDYCSNYKLFNVRDEQDF